MTAAYSLKQEALQINDFLTRYVDLHNRFLRSAGTFWSLFRKVDFKQFTVDAYAVFENIRNESAKIEKMNAEDGTIEKQFLGVLTRYTNALMDTSYLLYVMVQALRNKAEGESLSMSDHMANDKRYKDSIKVYTSYGGELNRLFEQMKD